MVVQELCYVFAFIYIIFLFVGKEKTYSKVIRLLCTISCIIITIIQLCINLKLGIPYVTTLISIILWFLPTISTIVELIKQHRTF